MKECVIGNIGSGKTTYIENFIKEHPDYVICGDTNYLNIEGENNSVCKNMLLLKNEKYLVKDIMTLKAIYLKD